MRVIGEAKRPDIRYKMRPGAYGIVMKAGRIMLVEEHGSDENLQLPGGGIDPGESPIMALHREFREETGWHIARPQHFWTYRRYPYMPEYGFWAEKVCHIFIADAVRPHGAPSEPGHSVHWLDPVEAIEALGTPGNREALLRATGSRLR